MLLDTGINGGDFSPLNKVGIVICLTGVALHVFRKVKMVGSADAGGQSKVKNCVVLRRNQFVSYVY